MSSLRIITNCIHTFSNLYETPSYDEVNYISYIANILPKYKDAYEDMLYSRQESSLLQYMIIALLKKQLRAISPNHPSLHTHIKNTYSQYESYTSQQLSQYLNDNNISWYTTTVPLAVHITSKIPKQDLLHSHPYLTKFTFTYHYTPPRKSKRRYRTPFTPHGGLRPLILQQLTRYEFDYKVVPNLTNDNHGEFKLEIYIDYEDTFFATLPFMKQYRKYIIFKEDTYYTNVNIDSNDEDVEPENIWSDDAQDSFRTSNRYDTPNNQKYFDDLRFHDTTDDPLFLDDYPNTTSHTNDPLFHDDHSNTPSYYDDFWNNI